MQTNDGYRLTTKEYSAYEKRVQGFMEREGVNSFSIKEDEPEPYFTWRACECCGSPLGGDRYAVESYCEKTKEIYEYEICGDCYYYAEYGQLDDMTMADMFDCGDCKAGIVNRNQPRCYDCPSDK